MKISFGNNGKDYTITTFIDLLEKRTALQLPMWISYPQFRRAGEDPPLQVSNRILAARNNQHLGIWPRQSTDTVEGTTANLFQWVEVLLSRDVRQLSGVNLKFRQGLSTFFEQHHIKDILQGLPSESLLDV